MAQISIFRNPGRRKPCSGSLLQFPERVFPRGPGSSFSGSTSLRVQPSLRAQARLQPLACLPPSSGQTPGPGLSSSELGPASWSRAPSLRFQNGIPTSCGRNINYNYLKTLYGNLPTVICSNRHIESHNNSPIKLCNNSSIQLFKNYSIVIFNSYIINHSTN
jgi:hypothetical protein